jgi:hypothetical protein
MEQGERFGGLTGTAAALTETSAYLAQLGADLRTLSDDPDASPAEVADQAAAVASFTAALGQSVAELAYRVEAEQQEQRRQFAEVVEELRATRRISTPPGESWTPLALLLRRIRRGAPS